MSLVIINMKNFRFYLFYFIFCVVFLMACERPRFELIKPEISGIHFNNEIIQEDTFNILRNEYIYNGGGVGVADLNNDSLPDLIFAGNKVLTRIYLNQGNFHFMDITKNFEGLTNKQWISGISVADVNADGWTDLYFTSTQSLDSNNRRNQLWINQGLTNGLPAFIEQAAQYGIDDSGYSMHSAFLDYDLDGDLDLYILNNIVNKHVPTNYRPKLTDGSAINNDKFYKNLGNGKFVDATLEAGIIYEGYGLGIAVGDINKDGYPDLYISNDYISNDLMYINQRNGTFKNMAREYLSYQSRFSMGNDVADYNNDGNLDIITMDMMPEQYYRKKQTINGNSYFVYVNNEKYNYEPQYVRNMLQVHNGFINGQMVPYSEIGQMTGVYQTEWSWSPLFADFDNDGDRDLFITNGYPRDLTDKDFTNYKAGMAGSLLSDESLIKEIPIVKVSNFAFEQQDSYKFADKTVDWGLSIPSFSNGAAFVDLDIDGDLDYVVNNINDSAFIYRNNSIENKGQNQNYLQLDLRGIDENTIAIGSKVQVWFGGKYLFAEKNLSRGYISTVDPVLHFGLGNASLIDSIKIVWPTGVRQTKLRNVPVNRRITLLEQNATVAHKPIMSKQNQLFKSIDLINYNHRQTDYIDFFHGQNILQHKFSQVGPCMASGDLTGDGTVELLIGASDTQATSVYTFDDDSLKKIEYSGLTGQRKCQEADILILDIDNDQDNDVVSLSGGYDVEDESLYEHYLFRNQGNSFVREKLPIPPFSASIVRAFDYDKDGDLDLFVGARIKKGKFPYANYSYLITNNKGRLTVNKENHFDIGMVVDATWTDFNGDGWQDLLVAREWNSIVVLQNDNGKTFELTMPKGFNQYAGLWSSIAAKDFDNDGDDDYVVGNLGENHRFSVSGEFPLRLYAVDIDKNGSIDPIVSSYWKDKENKMQEYPVNYLDELSAQSPFFRKMFTSYATFSYTTLKDMLNADTIKNVFKVNTTSSYVIWNNKDSFQWQKLPASAQVSPIKKILIHDFNGDKRPDLLLAGNDFAYDVSTGYFDANRGVVLLGSDKQNFKSISSAETGLTISGQVESLLLLPTNSPVLVVGINRKSIQTYLLSNH